MAVYNFLLPGRTFVVNGFRSLLISRVLVRYQSNDNIHQREEEYKSSNEETEEEYEQKTKRKILIASMNFVPELGWSRQAISAGAESIGYPGIIHGMFPNGGAELVAHFYSTSNNELNQILKEKYETIQADPAKKVENPREQISYAMETRLRMIIPYKKNWSQAIALMTLPPNVPTSLANLVTLVDDICYYTGDRSIDITWYTKRIVLAGIYKTTELYMLQDNSNDHEHTWNFLKRRIDEADQLHRIISATSDLQPEQTLKQVKEIASATIITARNILGWNVYR
ncbi:ubiquinone biosynthesis protein COQ9, mitochondrial-like [Vespa mandarinia]|uniref:ubiquinone biosynthesis protein COQ9, mitochondrial-like n=1 Tax=Vespa mandarinia TaxID=7446 RepID=UPI001613BF2F|nr:ubiquinone biosynthesis protein COQ9, mitochondrial-like [Vespa mandarinia]